MKRVRWWWVMVSVCGFSACGKTSGTAQHDSCVNDNDCKGAQICERSAATREKIQICLIDECAQDDGCVAGHICELVDDGCQYWACLPACDATSCAADEVCLDNGRCELIRCDEPNAMPCDEHWRCDPTLAETESEVQNGSNVPSPDPARAIARGCVRIRCDEPGGFTCRELWGCSPETSSDASGCVPRPCEELGRCSNDELYICQPTSTGPHSSARDIHGCVRRNCEEGYSCSYQVAGQNFASCEPTAEEADSNGCIRLDCSEVNGGCLATETCDVGAPHANDIGCRPLTCAEGSVCPVGWECKPDSANADSRGCLWVDTSTAGGGSSASTTSAGGAASSASTTGGELGQCVDP